MPVLPDPRGLFMQAAAGPLFLRSFFYPFFIFMWIHYNTVWMTGPFNQMPVLDMWKFLVLMAYYFTYGAVGAYALSWAMGHPVQIPAHDFHKLKAHPAPMLTSLAIALGIHFVMYATGLAFAHEPFPSLPNEINWLLFVVCVLVLLTIGVLTWRESKSVFAFRYTDIREQSIIAEFGVLLIFVLGPQAIWDFFVLPPPNGFGWLQWQAGALTIGVEVLVWLVAYWWFGTVRRVDQTIFTRKRSLVNWMEYCLIVGGNQIALGIAYVIAADLLVDLFALNIFLLAVTAVMLVESAIIYRWLRSRPRAMGVRFNAPVPKTNPSGSDTPTHRRSQSRRLELGDIEPLDE
jgi:hypothetical protein